MSSPANIERRLRRLENRPRPVGWQKLLAIVSFILAFIGAAYLYADVQRAGDLQKGCERTNTTRDALVTVWRKAAHLQAASVEDLPPSSHERQSVERYSWVLRDKARELVVSVEEFADEHGSPVVDCDEAFPSPFGI